jgi:tetratricopeptide (TPR) repeat protein
LERVPLSDEERELARDHYLQPGIFQVPCAHTVAVRRQFAGALLRNGDFKKAIKELKAACEDDPGDPEGLLDLASAQELAGDLEQARRTLNVLLNRPLSMALRARALSALANVELRDGADAKAQNTLEQVLGLPLSDSMARSTISLLVALQHHRMGPALKQALGPHGSRGNDTDLLLLRFHEAMDAAPEEGLPPYLLGRELYLKDRPLDALPYLERAVELPLPDARLYRETMRLIGICAYENKDRNRARAAFTALRDGADTPAGLRLVAEEFLRRIEFDQEHMIALR